MFLGLLRPRSSRIAVRVTHRPPAPILRYVDQIAPAPSEGLELRYAPGPLRRFDVDVVHVADEQLDTLIGAPSSHPLRWALATTLLVCLLRVGRIALVRQVDPSTLDTRHPRPLRVARGLLDRSTTMFVGFDETVSSPHADRFKVVPHAHFRDRFIGYPRATQVAGRVLCIGTAQLDPHADAVVFAVRAARTPGVSGRLAGSVAGDIANRLLTACAQHPNELSIRLDVLSDGAHIQEIDASELVIAPATETLEQLQGVFLALSLDRPVLTRRSDAMVRLADDVGAGWVHLYNGALTGADIDAALASARATPTSRPDLDGRNLATVRAAYADLFHAAAAVRRGRQRRA